MYLFLLYYIERKKSVHWRFETLRGRLAEKRHRYLTNMLIVSLTTFGDFATLVVISRSQMLSWLFTLSDFCSFITYIYIMQLLSYKGDFAMALSNSVKNASGIESERWFFVFMRIAKDIKICYSKTGPWYLKEPMLWLLLNQENVI